MKPDRSLGAFSETVIVALADKSIVSSSECTRQPDGKKFEPSLAAIGSST